MIDIYIWPRARNGVRDFTHKGAATRHTHTIDVPAYPASSHVSQPGSNSSNNHNAKTIILVVVMIVVVIVLVMIVMI